MEHKNVLNVLNEANDSKFVTRKWNIVNNQSNANHDVGKKIIYNAEVLKSNLCDFIFARGDITDAAAPATQVSFKSCAPFTKCITKIDGTTTNNAEDLDLVMPMYNLREYGSNYSKKQKVYGFIQKMKQLILMQILLMIIILNLSNIMLNY